MTETAEARRLRSRSFGAEAQRYDRARPTYPAALMDTVLAHGPGRALDVGCGTGRVARLLLARGCDVLGVEPDARMAEVARSHGVAVEVSTFEDWEARGRTFDILVSGQAWHWIDPEVGVARAEALLRPGGRLALFWNVSAHEEENRRRLTEAYVAEAPHLAEVTSALSMAAIDGDEVRTAELIARAAFTAPELLAHPWARRYSREEWVDLLRTHSDHMVLPEQQRERLLAAVGAIVDSLGGSLLVHYATVVIVADRLAGAAAPR